MTKAPDFDLDMKDIQGETQTAQPAVEELTDADLQQLGVEDIKEFKQYTEEEEWQETLKRLNDATKYTWFCVPNEDGTIEIGEVSTASNELFVRWANYIWPLDAEKRKPEMFNTPALKEKAIFNILQYMKAMISPKGKSKIPLGK
jgi:hypothetical protein